MEKVKGIGGIFFKSNQNSDLADWYKKNLGVPATEYGCGVFGDQNSNSSRESYTVWSVMPNDTEYFNHSKASFMVNYIVDDLDKMVAQLKANGVKLEGKIDTCEQGRFAWGYDPDGNKFELWEPLEK